jgi:hypothetical protein
MIGQETGNDFGLSSAFSSHSERYGHRLCK